jgi:hypothetical protein
MWQDAKDKGRAPEPEVLRFRFKFWNMGKQGEIFTAEGEQKIAFLYARGPDRWERGHLPDSLKAALVPFGLSPE